MWYKDVYLPGQISDIDWITQQSILHFHKIGYDELNNGLASTGIIALFWLINILSEYLKLNTTS